MSDTTVARMSRRAAAGGAASLLLAGAASAAVPGRIVSLNPCLDAILVQVAGRGQIAALSPLSRSPHTSSIAAIARTFPFTYETAEEVVALRPDLVIASVHTALATRNALKRLGVRVELFGVPDTVVDSLAQVRAIGWLVGRPQAGEALALRIEAAVAAAAPPPGTPVISALVFQPNGFAAGPETLVGRMLDHAGIANAAARYGLRSWGNVALEQVIADPPQLLLAGETAPGAPTWAERLVDHPALRRLGGRMRRATFPQRLLYCGGPTLIETAAVLAKARRGAMEAMA